MTLLHILYGPNNVEVNKFFLVSALGEQPHRNERAASLDSGGLMFKSGHAAVLPVLALFLRTSRAPDYPF